MFSNILRISVYNREYIYDVALIIIVFIASIGVMNQVVAGTDQDKDACKEILMKPPNLRIEGTLDMPPMSDMMKHLYGKEVAGTVYNRLQNLDPDLNREIQRVAYDHYWARPGLSIRDKSFVTVVSLIALGKEEQIRIHLNGFLNAGGTAGMLADTLVHMGLLVSPTSARNGLTALLEVLNQRHVSVELIKEINTDVETRLNELTKITEIGLSVRDDNILEVSTFVAVGDLTRLKTAMVKYFNFGGEMEDLKNVLIHQIVYCGFPSAMNGFAVLKDLISTSKK